MPNSLKSSAIASPVSRRATNCSLSSITEHSFQGITPSPSTGRKCYLCVRYNVLPMSQVAHKELASISTKPLRGVKGHVFRALIASSCRHFVEFPSLRCLSSRFGRRGCLERRGQILLGRKYQRQHSPLSRVLGWHDCL